MKQYPADFRDRLLHALDAGLARAEAARTFGVTDRTIRRWQQRRRETGTVAPTPRQGRRRHIGPQVEAVLREHVRTHSDPPTSAPKSGSSPRCRRLAGDDVAPRLTISRNVI
jgi:transposase